MKSTKLFLATVAAATVAANLFAAGIAEAEAGSCDRSAICTSYNPLPRGSTDNGYSKSTYRFNADDSDLRNNSYTNKSDVDNDAPSVRNRISSSMACGYVNPAGQGNNYVIWKVGYNVSGWEPVNTNVSALRIYTSTSGKQVPSSKCPAKW